MAPAQARLKSLFVFFIWFSKEELRFFEQLTQKFGKDNMEKVLLRKPGHPLSLPLTKKIIKYQA
jgi:hypothetical protein